MLQLTSNVLETSRIAGRRCGGLVRNLKRMPHVPSAYTRHTDNRWAKPVSRIAAGSNVNVTTREFSPASSKHRHV